MAVQARMSLLGGTGADLLDWWWRCGCNRWWSAQTYWSWMGAEALQPKAVITVTTDTVVLVGETNEASLSGVEVVTGSAGNDSVTVSSRTTLHLYRAVLE